MKKPAVYIMANKRNGTLYAGVTSNFFQRIYQDKNQIFKGFTDRYKCKILVYYEVFYDREHAILREKQLKGGSRKQKLKLIESKNPLWHDFMSLFFDEFGLLRSARNDIF